MCYGGRDISLIFVLARVSKFEDAEGLAGFKEAAVVAENQKKGGAAVVAEKEELPKAKSKPTAKTKANPDAPTGWIALLHLCEDMDNPADEKDQRAGGDDPSPKAKERQSRVE